MSPFFSTLRAYSKGCKALALVALVAAGCSVPPTPAPPTATLLPVIVEVIAPSATATRELTHTSTAPPTPTPLPTGTPVPAATSMPAATSTPAQIRPAASATVGVPNTAEAPTPTSNPPTDTPAAAAAMMAAAAPLPNGVTAQDVANAEQHTLDLINAQRAAAGLAPLARDETLMNIARARVADMVARHYTGHTDPVTGVSLGKTMMRAAGYTSGFMAENWFGHAQGPAAAADAAMAWFMTDPPHAANILSPNFAGVGAGLAYNGQLWLLIQDFAGK